MTIGSAIIFEEKFDCCVFGIVRCLRVSDHGDTTGGVGFVCCIETAGWVGETTFGDEASARAQGGELYVSEGELNVEHRR